MLLHLTDKQPLAQLTYGALLSGRTSMVADSSNSAKKVSGPDTLPASRDTDKIGIDNCCAICCSAAAVQQWQEPGEHPMTRMFD
jgi:hypothetical protein